MASSLSFLLLFLTAQAGFAALTGKQVGYYELNVCPDNIGEDDKYCQYGSWTFGSDDESTNEHLTVYSPAGSGTYPVIFFVSGFGGNAPVWTYDEFLQKVASAGYIIVGIDQARVPNYEKHSKSIARLIHWSYDNLADLLTEINVPARPDMSRIFLGGQSAGCHTVTQTLKIWQGACSPNVKGLFLIDPVDGYDPFGLLDNTDVIDAEYSNGAYTRIEKLNFAVPTYYVAAGLDDESAVLGVSCAPASLSLDRFWYSSNGPIWGFNATRMGHTDILSEFFADLPTCPSDSDDSIPKRSSINYKNLVATKIVDFLNGNAYDGDDRIYMIQSLEDLDSHKEFLDEVTIYKDYNNKNPAHRNIGCQYYYVPETCQTRRTDGVPSACRQQTSLLEAVWTGCSNDEFKVEGCTDSSMFFGLVDAELCCPNGYQFPPYTYVPPPTDAPTNVPTSGPTFLGQTIEPTIKPSSAPTGSPTFVEVQDSGDNTSGTSGIIGGIFAFLACFGAAMFFMNRRRKASSAELALETKPSPNQTRKGTASSVEFEQWLEGQPANGQL